MQYNFDSQWSVGSGSEVGGPTPPVQALTISLFPPEHYGYAAPSLGAGLPLSAAHPSLPAPCHDLQSSAAGVSAVGYGGAVDSGPSGYFLSSGGIRPNGAPALESPRIEITSYLGLHQNSSQFLHEVDVEDVLPKRSPSTATLNLPSLEAYRDPSCLSPASSLQSEHPLHQLGESLGGLEETGGGSEGSLLPAWGWMFVGRRRAPRSSCCAPISAL